MSFREHLETEPVSSLPIRNAIVGKSGTLIRAAIAGMRAHKLGCVVIVDHHSYPTHIFTESSVVELLLDNVGLDDTPIKDYVDTRFVVVKSSDPIARVWDAIQDDDARFVCVTDDEGKLIGITGQRGMSEYIADHFAKQVSVQRIGSTPWLQEREGA